jgi:GMP synthase (glutamine-hydrolysing)
MKKPIRILVIDGYTQEGRDQFTNNNATPAGELYDRMLKRHSPLPLDVTLLFPADPGVQLPDAQGLSEFDGIAWTGCSLCLNDDIEPVRKQIQLAKDGFESGVPSFGSCWAAQIAVVAAGGAIKANAKGREQGISRKIQLTQEGKTHPMFEGKPEVFDAFTSHDDEVVDLSPFGVNLCGNAWSKVQAVDVQHKNGTFWAVQYHPEYHLGDMAALVNCRIPKLIKRGFFPNEITARTYIEDLQNLHDDPSRRDIAWRLGIDSDIEDEDIRCLEVKNWIEKQVIAKLS